MVALFLCWCDCPADHVGVHVPRGDFVLVFGDGSEHVSRNVVWGRGRKKYGSSGSSGVSYRDQSIRELS